MGALQDIATLQADVAEIKGHVPVEPQDTLTGYVRLTAGQLDREYLIDCYQAAESFNLCVPDPGLSGNHWVRFVMANPKEGITVTVMIWHDMPEDMDGTGFMFGCNDPQGDRHTLTNMGDNITIKSCGPFEGGTCFWTKI